MERRNFIKGVMLYTPGLALPLMAGIGRYSPKTKAGEDWQTACDTICEVDQTLATTRETNFVNWKQGVLNNLCSCTDNASIPVDPGNFLTMLQNFKNSAKGYNGVRVYFAAGDQSNGNPAGLPLNQVGMLTVIFVPTSHNPNYISGGDDDLSQCWWLYNNNAPYNFPLRDPAHPENDIAKRWVYNYRNNKANATNGLRAKGQQATGEQHYGETNSLWYTMTSIGGGTVAGQPDCGIIGYLQSRMTGTNPIDSMKIAFGAYDKSENVPYYYQLLTQFDIHLAGAAPNSYIRFGPSTLKQYLLKRNLHMKVPMTAGSNTTDTGLPCPPAESCPGSEF